MPQLRVVLKPRRDEDAIPGEFVIDASFTNVSSEPARLNIHQASRPALVLEIVRDRTHESFRLAPPSAPSKEDLGPGDLIAPGASVTITYAGMLDRSLEAGTYRVRYFSPYPSLGGSRDDPLKSQWVQFTVRTMTGFPRVSPLRPADPHMSRIPTRRFSRFYCLHRLACLIRRLVAIMLGRGWCDRVLTREVDEWCTETMSNAPPGAEAWNNTWEWPARFLVVVDEAACRVTVAVRVRIVGSITDAQRIAWEESIETAWSNQFEFWCPCCCCPDGYKIVIELQFVTSGEHYVVTAGADTTAMRAWGVNDTEDIDHEFGHMLGALDEYFTVDGVDYNGYRQPGGNIMNNPANPPAAHHYHLVREAVRQLLNSNCVTRAVS